MKYIFLLSIICFVSEVFGAGPTTFYVAIVKDNTKGPDAPRSYGASQTSSKEAVVNCQLRSKGYTCELVPADFQVVVYKRSDGLGRIGIGAAPAINANQSQTFSTSSASQHSIPVTADAIAQADCSALIDSDERNAGVSCNQINSYMTKQSIESESDSVSTTDRYFVAVARGGNVRSYGASRLVPQDQGMSVTTTNGSSGVQDHGSALAALTKCQKWSQGVDCNQVAGMSIVVITQPQDGIGRLGIGVAKAKNEQDFDASSKASDMAQKDCMSQFAPNVTGISCNQINQYLTVE